VPDVDRREGGEVEDPGRDEENPGEHAPEHAEHTPPDEDRHLRRLRARQDVHEVEGADEVGVLQPVTPLDALVVHQSELSDRSPEGQPADPEEHPDQLGETDIWSRHAGGRTIARFTASVSIPCDTQVAFTPWGLTGGRMTSRKHWWLLVPLAAALGCAGSQKEQKVTKAGGDSTLVDEGPASASAQGAGAAGAAAGAAAAGQPGNAQLVPFQGANGFTVLMPPNPEKN